MAAIAYMGRSFTSLQLHYVGLWVWGNRENFLIWGKGKTEEIFVFGGGEVSSKNGQKFQVHIKGFLFWKF